MIHGGLAEDRAAVGQSLDEPLIHGREALRPLGVSGQEPADSAGDGLPRGALLAPLQLLSTHRGVGGPRRGQAVADRVYRVLRRLPAHRGQDELEGPGPVRRIDAHPFRGLAHDLDLETLLRPPLAETLARAHRVEVGHGNAQQLPEIGPRGRVVIRARPRNLLPGDAVLRGVPLPAHLRHGVGIDEPGGHPVAHQGPVRGERYRTRLVEVADPDGHRHRGAGPPGIGRGHRKQVAVGGFGVFAAASVADFAACRIDGEAGRIAVGERVDHGFAFRVAGPHPAQSHRLPAPFPILLQLEGVVGRPEGRRVVDPGEGDRHRRHLAVGATIVDPVLELVAGRLAAVVPVGDGAVVVWRRRAVGRAFDQLDLQRVALEVAVVGQHVDERGCALGHGDLVVDGHRRGLVHRQGEGGRDGPRRCPVVGGRDLDLQDGGPGRGAAEGSRGSGEGQPFRQRGTVRQRGPVAQGLAGQLGVRIGEGRRLEVEQPSGGGLLSAQRGRPGRLVLLPRHHHRVVPCGGVVLGGHGDREPVGPRGQLEGAGLAAETGLGGGDGLTRGEVAIDQRGPAVGRGRLHRETGDAVVQREGVLGQVGVEGWTQYSRRDLQQGQAGVGARQGRAGAGRRPGPGALVVSCPHLHLVGGVRVQAAQVDRRAEAVEAGIGEPAGPRAPVLHLVGGEGRTARVLRGRPGHRQARQRCGRHHRRIRGQGRLRHVGDDDGHRLTGAAPAAIADLDPDRIPRSSLVIERRPGLHLAVAGVHGKGSRVRPRQGVGQRVTVGVGRRQRRPHRLAGGRVLRYAPLDLEERTGRSAQPSSRVCAARRVHAEDRTAVDPGAPRSGRRPGPDALVVSCPHLHLVGGVRGQAAQARRRGESVEAGVGERALPRDPVLHLVGGQGRTARVLRGRPGHRQARQRRGRHQWRAGSQGRFRNVGDDDGHRLTRAAPVAIADVDLHRIPRPGLVVERRPGPHLAGVHGKGSRVRPRQGVGQHVAVGVGRRQRRPDRLAGGRVLRHPPLHLGGSTGGTPQPARRVRGESRAVVDPGAPRDGRRPGPGALVVAGAHLHLVGGVRVQAAQVGPSCRGRRGRHR